MHVASSVFTAAVPRPQYPTINTSGGCSEYSDAITKFRGLAGAGYILHDLRMKGGKTHPSRHSPFDMAKQRRDELDRLLVARAGSLRLETDDASYFALIYAHHCDTPEQAAEALRVRFPALGDVERLSIVTASFARPRKYKADPLAAMLNVTMAERERLGFKTIGACDVSREERDRIAAAKKSERDRARKEQMRRAAGARPRATGDEAAAEAAALGISRSALFKRRRKAKAAVHSNGATIKTRDISTSAVRVHLRAQTAAAAQPAARPDWTAQGAIWAVSFNRAVSLPWPIPVVAANSDPATARLAARVSAHAAAHRKAARVFAMMRRAA